MKACLVDLLDHPTYITTCNFRVQQKHLHYNFHTKNASRRFHMQMMKIVMTVLAPVAFQCLVVTFLSVKSPRAWRVYSNDVWLNKRISLGLSTSSGKALILSNWLWCIPWLRTCKRWSRFFIENASRLLMSVNENQIPPLLLSCSAELPRRLLIKLLSPKYFGRTFCNKRKLI